MREDEFQKLKEQRMELITEFRTFTDKMQERASENGGSIIAEDEQEHERRGNELLDFNKRIEAENRTRALLAVDPAAISVSKEGAPPTLQEFRKSTLPRQALIGADVTQAEIDMPDTRQAVWKWIMHGREGLDFEEYRVLSKAASGGGFFVSTDLADNIVRAMRFLPGGVGALARNITTADGSTIQIARNLTHGTAAWIAESGSYTPSDETLTQGTISAFKAGTKIIVSEELLTDSDFDLEPFISQEFGERIGALAEDAYINGDGSGKPQGILDAGSGVATTTLPAGFVTETNMTWRGLAQAVYSVPAQYRDENMAILTSDAMLLRLIGMQDTTGAPLWNASVAAGNPDTFAGKPIYTHPNLPAPGVSAKSMIVGNFNRGYLIRRVNGVYMQRQNELHSDSGQVGFRAYLRIDGRTQLADALRIVAFAAT